LEVFPILASPRTIPIRASANNAAIAAPELSDLTVDHIVFREAVEAEARCSPTYAN
jgi:hypothetical protein